MAPPPSSNNQAIAVQGFNEHAYRKHIGILTAAIGSIREFYHCFMDRFISQRLYDVASNKPLPSS